MTGPTVTREQALAHRVRVQALDRPSIATDLAVWDLGLQDSPAGSAVQALAARLPGGFDDVLDLADAVSRLAGTGQQLRKTGLDPSAARSSGPPSAGPAPSSSTARWQRPGAPRPAPSASPCPSSPTKLSTQVRRAIESESTHIARSRGAADVTVSFDS